MRNDSDVYSSDEEEENWDTVGNYQAYIQQ